MKDWRQYPSGRCVYGFCLVDRSVRCFVLPASGGLWEAVRLSRQGHKETVVRSVLYDTALQACNQVDIWKKRALQYGY